MAAHRLSQLKAISCTWEEERGQSPQSTVWMNALFPQQEVSATYDSCCFTSPQHMQVLDTGLRGEGWMREDTKKVEGPPLSAGCEQEHPTGVRQRASNEPCIHATHLAADTYTHTHTHTHTLHCGTYKYLGSKLMAANLWSCPWQARK